MDAKTGEFVEEWDIQSIKVSPWLLSKKEKQ